MFHIIFLEGGVVCGGVGRNTITLYLFNLC